MIARQLNSKSTTETIKEKTEEAATIKAVNESLRKALASIK